MAHTLVTYREVRFVIEDEQTHCYVYCDTNDGFWPVHGWHHKAFPASVNALEILRLWQDCKEDPLMWEQQAPPVTRD